MLGVAPNDHAKQARKWQLVASRNGLHLTLDTFDKCQDAVTAAGALHGLMALADSGLHLALRTADAKAPAEDISFETRLPGYMSWHAIRLVLLFAGQTESFAGLSLDHGLGGLVELSWERVDAIQTRAKISFRGGLAADRVQSIK